MTQSARIPMGGLEALDARDRMLRGEFSAIDFVGAWLASSDELEPEIGAFAFLDRDHALKQARALDAWRGSGRATGPLHGLPVAVKDTVDTADMPTENGITADIGRRPEKDATVVQRLRAAGAVILGKTVTTELGSMTPRGTRNPRNPAHTPGGSSSGSAAAVAAGMAPLSVGTQTNGSVIRPASFCGVLGFKPSFGLIPRSGVLPQARPLDTIGVFARTITDAALIADALAGYDPGDPDSLNLPAPRLLDTALANPPVRPALAFVKSPAWELADETTKEAFAELTAALGPACEEVTLPNAFGEAAGALRTLTLAGIARNYGRYLDRGAKLSPFMQGAIADGRKVTAVDYLAARDWQASLGAGLDVLFDKYDAIVTPAARGEAPEGIDSTGDPVFCTLWTFCGVPAVSLPLLDGPRSLPVGVQLIGRRGDDARLLRTARWLVGRLAEDEA